MEIKARLFRNYPLGEMGSHAIGYIGRINQSEKERIAGRRRRSQLPGHRVHRQAGRGAELRAALHGITGVEQMETSAGGRAVRRLRQPPSHTRARA